MLQKKILREPSSLPLHNFKKIKVFTCHYQKTDTAHGKNVQPLNAYF